MRRLISSVPNVELFARSDVKSRVRLGAVEAPTEVSSKRVAIELRSKGDVRFSGPGAPSLCPAPAMVALVSKNRKSAALSFESFGWPPLPDEHPSAVPKTPMLPGQKLR